MRRDAFPAARTALLALALAVAACRPVPRGDGLPPPAGVERACPARVEPDLDGLLEIDVGARTVLAFRGAATFSWRAGRHRTDTTLACLLAAASTGDGASWFAVGCRRSKQMIVRLADRDGDDVPAEVVGEREVLDPGTTREVAWDGKRHVLYLYVEGAKAPRVLRLVDDDRDGIPDREERYVDGATTPALVESGRTMWVEAATGELVIGTWAGCVVREEDEVTSIRDADGDGRPEAVERMSEGAWRAR